MTQGIRKHLVGLLITMWSMTALADAGIRLQEILQCKDSEIVTWGDGQDRPTSATALIFFYKHSGAPPWFQEYQVINLLARASAEWSKCGIPAQVTAWQGPVENTKGIIVVQWDSSGSGGHFGLANLSANQLSLGTQAFQMLNQRNPTHNALDTLQMVLAHEMGHFYGMLAHSRRCIDVLSYYNDGKGGQCYARDLGLLKQYPEYRSSLPTACDIQRCKVLNRMP
jgi:hypothetical protein